MSGTAHNSLTTILLLIPMLAVPMLAVFGIPEFSSVIRSPQADAAGHSHSERNGARRSAAAFDGVEDVVVEPIEDVRDTASSVAWFDESAEQKSSKSAGVVTKPSRPSSNPSPARRSREAMVVPAAGTAENVQALPVYRRTKVEDKTVESQSVSPDQLGAPLTWTNAVQRLNELEIRNFRLERGHLPDQFLFMCSYTPADNPRVSYRFEAEADEPLRAVDKVLAQIDKWLATR